MYKDNKVEGGYRQVVGGCSSNIVGLSNMISEVLESVASAIDNLYAVISSEDMLARINDANMKIENMTREKNKEVKNENVPKVKIVAEILDDILDQILDTKSSEGGHPQIWNVRKRGHFGIGGKNMPY